MTKLTEKEILENINKKLLIFNNIEFIKIKNPDWKNTRTIILIVKCKLHNLIGEVNYRNFIRSGWSCRQCKSEKISKSKSISEKDALDEINRIINYFNNSRKGNISFLGFENNKFINGNTKLIIKCNIHNLIGYPKYSEFKRKDKLGWLCPECVKEKVSSKRKITAEKAQEMVYNIYGYDTKFSKVKETFKDYGEPVTLICPIHGEYEISFRTLVSSRGKGTCPLCDLEKISYTEEKAVSVLNIKLKEKEDLFNIFFKFLGFEDNKWNGSFTKITLQCNKHKNIWKTTFNNFMKKTYIGCKDCLSEERKWRSSNMEYSCYNLLKEYNSNIVRQKYIKIENREIFVDFYIPELNTIIEYDGEQHTHWIKYFQSTYQDFVNQVNRDRCLEQYCKENNIYLLRIPYKDNNRIPEIIKIFFEEGKDITTKIEPKLLPVLYHG